MDEKEYLVEDAATELGVTVGTVWHHLNRLRIDPKWYGKVKGQKGRIAVLNEKQMEQLRRRNERA